MGDKIRITSIIHKSKVLSKHNVVHSTLFILMLALCSIFISSQAFADTGTVSTDVGNYPSNAYFQDHGAFITITDNSCGAAGQPTCTANNISVTLTNNGGHTFTLPNQFTLSGTNTYTLPTNYVYFNTKAMNEGTARPTFLVTCPATGSNPCDTVTVTSSTITLTNNQFNIQSNNTGSFATDFPSRNPNGQPTLTYIGNTACNIGPPGGTSGDGICDDWKTVDANNRPTGLQIQYKDANNNIVTYTLRCSGTNPPDPVCPVRGQKDVYVEMDYLEGQFPPSFNSAITNVVNAFSPMGITLHVLVDDSIPHHYDLVTAPSAGSQDNTQWDYLKTYYFGNSTERTPGQCTATTDVTGITHTSTCVSDLLTAKRQVFHYAIVTHSQAGGYSGNSESPGNDEDISLGYWAGGTGTSDDFAGTFMHELGHNLGLKHGGGDNINCKPNYFSVMNWARQFSTLFLPTIRPLAYSSEANPTWVNPGETVGRLIETNNNLDENVGVTASAAGQTFFYGNLNGGPYPGTTGTSPLNGALNPTNWNRPTDNTMEMTSTTVHYIPQVGCTNSTSAYALIGYDDTQLLKLNMWASSNGGTPSSMYDGAPAQ